MNKKTVLQIFYVLIALAFFIMLLILSFQNGKETAATSGKFTRIIVKIYCFITSREFDAALIKKWDGWFRHNAHFFLFMLFEFVMYLAVWVENRVIRLSAATVLPVVMAIITETLKVNIAGRHCNVDEIWLNIYGVLFAAAVMGVIIAIRQIIERNRR